MRYMHDPCQTRCRSAPRVGATARAPRFGHSGRKWRRDCHFGRKSGQGAAILAGNRSGELLSGQPGSGEACHCGRRWTGSCHSGRTGGGPNSAERGRRERALDHVRRAQVPPVPGGKVVERGHPVPVAGQDLDRLGMGVGVAVTEGVASLRGPGPRLGVLRDPPPPQAAHRGLRQRRTVSRLPGSPG